MSRPHRIRPLPDQTQPRLRVLVENSAPNPNRPRLDEDTEKHLDPVERRSASCYADMENRTARLRKLARDISTTRREKLPPSKK